MRILVLEEKHGPFYFPAFTDEELYNSALTILKGRYQSGQWYFLDEYSLKEPYMSLSDVQLLPEGKLKTTALNQHLKYQKQKAEREEDQKHYNNILRAIKNKDGKLAWEILQYRSDFEYEAIRLVKLTTEY